MAYRKSLASKVLGFCRRSSTEAAAARDGDGFLRRMLNQGLEAAPLSSSGKLLESLRSTNSHRLRLDNLRPPMPPDRDPMEQQASISVEDARKILRLNSVEVVKAKLRETGRSHISYSDYLKICCEGCGRPDHGLSLAKALDDSGAVLVLGNVVFLRPDQEEPQEPEEIES